MILSEFTPQISPPRKRFQLTPGQQMLLMPINDVHFGAPGFPEDRFIAHLHWGMERNAYFLSLADIMEFTSRSQRGILHNLRASQREILDAQNQQDIDKFVKLIAFTKDRWIGWHEGDHYHEFLDGTTSDQRLCQALGGSFLGTCALTDIRLNDSTRKKERGYSGCDVRIWSHHGLGGGRLAGSGLNLLEQAIKAVRADIYLMAHNHSKVSAPVDQLDRTRDGYIFYRKLMIARCGGWLRGYLGQRPKPPTTPAYLSRGTYVERGAMQPVSLGGLVISLGFKRVRPTPGRKTGGFYIPDIHWSV